MAPASTRTPLANVMVEINAEALDCGVCFLPLRPPLFQCEVGHSVCSSCVHRLGSPWTCRLCRAPVSGGYRRNHAMEKLVESIRVPCPNAAYGCTARPAYYDRGGHLHHCPRRPCYCPEDGCGFAAGYSATLLDHFTAVHEWPCFELTDWEWEVIGLHGGYNVLDIDNGAGRKFLFLLLVSRDYYSQNVVYALCLDTAIGSSDFTLMFEPAARRKDRTCFDEVPCTDLSRGLPGPYDWYPVMLPDSFEPDESGIINVAASIRFE